MGSVPCCHEKDNGVAMSGYSHLTAEERDRIAGLIADGLSLRAIGRALGRAASTISREPGRNALDSGAYRPHVADGAYMPRSQRAAALETDAKLAAHVTDRLGEGWTPERIAGRLRLGIEAGLRAVCAETVYGWIYHAAQKTGRLWRFLTRHHTRRRKRHGRASRDTIAEMTATLRLLDPGMRGSVTFDNDTCFARHMLLRGMLSATTYFCDAYATGRRAGSRTPTGASGDGCPAAPTSTRSASGTWIESNTWCPRLTAAMILSGSAVHVKGFGSGCAL